MLNTNTNCISEKESKKINFINRTKTSIFLVLYFLTLALLALFCDPQFQFISALSNKWCQFIFYIAIFLSTIWLNFFIAKEINNCFIGYKKIRNDIILFFMLLIFELLTIWILPVVGYGLINLDIIFAQIIFISILGVSLLLISISSIIYFKFNGILVTKSHLLGLLIIVLVYLTFVAGNYLIITKSWFVPILLVFISCINDVFAYLGGVLYGKHKFAPRLSPKKTWEGFITGMFVTLIISITLIFLLYFTNNSYTNINYSLIGSFVGWQWFNLDSISILNEEIIHWYWLVILCTICVIIATISVCGDLLFSYFKRFNRIKDFSNFIPGHGGVLDRMDSIILVSVLYFTLSIIVCLSINGFSANSFLISHFRIV